jgi:hypothetical protein
VRVNVVGHWVPMRAKIGKKPLLVESIPPSSTNHRQLRSLVAVATVCAALALVICLALVPRLYAEINTIYGEVRDGVAQFRVETDEVLMVGGFLMFNILLKVLI